MMRKPILFLTTLMVLSSGCEAYKILVVFPFPARSHNILGNGYVRHLLQAGHEVTYITPYLLKNPHVNLHQVDVSSNSDAYPDDALNIHSLMLKEQDLNDENFLFFSMLGVAEKTFENENVKRLMNDPKQQFDVIIAEWMFQEVYSGLAAVFNCPYIWSFPYEPHSIVLSLIDEVANPAYVPHMISSNVPPFTFTQRVQELWKQAKSLIFKNFYVSKFERIVYEKSFASALAKRGRPLPAYDEIKHNASLILGNSHVSLGLAMKLPQNYKSISGYYIEDDVKPLPLDLQNLMDNARHGVIYFSMGSNLKSKDLSDEIKQSLAKMFGELKQTVLWKFEKAFPGLPENVHILGWAPQHSILSHPNCILFITHGGLLSTIEAVHFGVPIIGIPVFVDQFNNVDRAVNKGVAKRVDLSYSVADDLRIAIRDMLEDRRYVEKARELSMIYHDRVAPPGRELAHWVEHVVRTRGAPHLRSPALLVPWYQKMYLDLAALVIVLLFSIKHLIVTCFSKRKSTHRTIKKKN